jgi:hypothetical protein
MTEVNVTKSIQVPAMKAWEVISSFRGIEKFSPIERSVVEGDGEGATRTCYMPDGAAISEVLSKVNNEQMQIQYEILEGPFPVTDYLSTVTVVEKDESSCEVSWGSQFEVASENEEAMKDLFNGFYTVIIDSLENLIDSQN